MKAWILLITLWNGSVSTVDGFKSKETCNTAAATIGGEIRTMQNKINKARKDTSAQAMFVSCVEIQK